MGFSKNLLSGVWRRARTADGILLNARDRARPRRCLRHLPYLSEERRLDENGAGSCVCRGVGNHSFGVMGTRTRVQETTNQPVRNLTIWRTQLLWSQY